MSVEPENRNLPFAFCIVQCYSRAEKEAEEVAMSFPVYDYRSDIRNLFVTPQLRSRFMRLEAGAVAQRHSHDLGHEVFLVHSVRAVGDEPMIMYLSVTPHLQPTHTYWSETGERLPHRFLPSSAYDVQTDTTTPIDELIDRHVA